MADLLERHLPSAGILVDPPVILEEDEFVLRVVARCEAFPVLLCEARLGLPFPPYALRQCWSGRVETAHAGSVTIFTDAAHSSFVWSWREARVGSRALYIEHRTPGEELTLETELASLRAGVPARAAVARGPSALAPEIAHALRPAFGLSHPVAEATTVDELLGAIQESEDPRQLGRGWRALTGLAILDSRCRDAGWLLEMGVMIEPLVRATLERLRSWIRDRAGGRCRPGPSFADLVEQAWNRRLHDGPGAFARRLIVQRNLYGIAGTPERASHCRGALLAFAGIREGPLSELDVNIRWGSVSDVLPGRTEVRRMLRALAGSGWDAPLMEELSALAFTRSALRERRLRLDCRQSEAARALRDLEALAARLAMQAGRLAKVVEPGPYPILHLWIEFPEVVDAGGFTAVRTGL